MAQASLDISISETFSGLYAELGSSVAGREKARRMPVFDFFYHLQAVRKHKREEATYQAQLHGRELKHGN